MTQDEYYELLDRIERLAIQDPPVNSKEAREMMRLVRKAEAWEAGRSMKVKQ